MSERWVTICRNPHIQVDLKTGQTAEFGTVMGGKPEYLRLGRLSKDALRKIKKLIGGEDV